MVPRQFVRQQLSQLANKLLESETLDEDDAYAAAGIDRSSAPGAIARGEAPGTKPVPGMPAVPAYSDTATPDTPAAASA